MIRDGRRQPERVDRDGVCEFEVIGELKDDPRRLMVLGDDGQCYALDIRTGQVTPLEPDDAWSVDAVDHAAGLSAGRSDPLAF